MRIAMLSWESQHSILAGGVGVHVSEISDALQQLGHEVHVFTRRGPNQSVHGFGDRVNYHRCDYAPQPDFVDDINSMCRAFVERVLRISDLLGPFDVIHAHDWLTANAMIWITQARGWPSILTIHSTEYARCGNALPQNSTSDRIRYQEWAGLDWADHVIAVSAAVKHELIEIYRTPADKIAIVHNGVHADRFSTNTDPVDTKRRNGIQGAAPVVLFCGRLSFHKGADLLLQAIPPLLRFYPDARVAFVGDGEMRSRLESDSRLWGIDHAVHFLGYRHGRELPELYGMADVVCVPSRNEPFGIVVLEAWSASKPLVVTQIGGPAEYVRHNVTGLHVYPHPDSIGWGLGTVFHDWATAQQMGRNGRRVAESLFTWDTIARRTQAVYASAAGIVKSPPVSPDLPKVASALPQLHLVIHRPHHSQSSPQSNECGTRQSIKETEHVSTHGSIESNF